MTFNSPKEKFIFFNIPIILFSLIPFFLVTGPFLSDFSISLIAVIFLIYCFKKNKFFFWRIKGHFLKTFKYLFNFHNFVFAIIV